MKKYTSVGITGGIGSGKTYVCQIIATMGYPVFYADAEAKKIISTNQKAILAIIDLFGEQAYQDGELNRPFLADSIFNDPILREKMNSIVHPLVGETFTNWAIASEALIVFNEAAILFETGSYKNYDKTILVIASEQLKIDRILNRDISSLEEIKDRMNVQWSDEKKSPMADFIINNDEKKPLLPQIVNIIEQLK